MKKELQRPAAWINSRYYELQAAGPVMIEEPEDDFKITVLEWVKIGIGVFITYVAIVMTIIVFG